MYPTATPLVSVGIYTLQANNPGPGYLVVFDSKSGTIYNAANGFNITLPSHLTTLATPTPVSMNNITLTSNAFSQSGAGIGYIFDKVCITQLDNMHSLTKNSVAFANQQFWQIANPIIFTPMCCANRRPPMDQQFCIRLTQANRQSSSTLLSPEMSLSSRLQ